MHLKLPWERKILSEIWTWPQITCFNYYGFWTNNITITETKRRLLNYFKLYNIISSIFMTISVIIATALKFHNGEILEGLVVIFTVAPTILGVIKMIQADRHMKTFQIAMKDIDELNKNTTIKHGVVMLEKTIRRTWIIFIVSLIIASFACLHWLIRPIFYIVLYNEKTMIVDSWPKLTDIWILFIPAYAYQFFLICCLGSFYIMFDDLFFSISEFVICHFDILKFKLRNLVMKKAPIDNLELRGIVEVHVQLLKVCKNVTAATDGVFVTQALITVSTYCVALYIVSKEKSGMNMVISLAEGVIAISVFLYLCSWYCNEITQKCRDFTTVAYMSDWTNWNQSQKKILLNLMTRTMSPVTFGGFLKIDLSTLINVLKTTFSYYNFLLAVLGNDAD